MKPLICSAMIRPSGGLISDGGRLMGVLLLGKRSELLSLECVRVETRANYDEMLDTAVIVGRIVPQRCLEVKKNDEAFCHAHRSCFLCV
jgi:hypothetical protein